MKQSKKKKKAPPKREQPPKIVKKVRKDLGKEKQAEDQQELARIWDEDLCE